MKTTKWSRKHGKCIKCKTDSLPHYSKGFCEKCYNQRWKAKNKEHVLDYQRKYRKEKKINAIIFLAYYGI